jgi:hypothetical protein
MATASVGALPAQDNTAAPAVFVDVPLALKPLAQPSFAHGVEFDGKDTAGCIAAVGSPRTGHFPCGVPVRAEALAAPPHAYRVTVDTDGDGDLEDEKPYELTPDGSFDLELRRTQGSQVRQLAYRLSYTRQEEREGRRGGEWMHISPLYRLEGRLRLGDEDALVGVLDVDADGDFDSGDMLRGTAIGIDVDGDGRIWGANEFFGAGRIIAFAGRHLVAAADALLDDGGKVRFQETTLAIPKVGEAVPPFSAASARRQRAHDGRHARPPLCDRSLGLVVCSMRRGHPEDAGARRGVREGRSRSARGLTAAPTVRRVCRRALAVVEKLALPKGHVAATGRAEQEPMWQMLGSMPEVRMMIPAYVVIDAGGIVRYAGRNLDEVKTALTAAAARDGAAKQAR